MVLPISSFDSLDEMAGEVGSLRVKKCSNCGKVFTAAYDRGKWQAHHYQIHFDFANDFPAPSESANGLIAELCDTPWNNDPHAKWFCSDKCEDEFTHPRDFNSEPRETRRRQVYYQNPRNGWHIQYRAYEYMGPVWLGSYQTGIFQYGQPREDYGYQRIRASYANLECHKRGSEIVPAFTGYRIRDLPSIKEHTRHGSALIDDGFKVITADKRLAIGALERYRTSMYGKA